MPKNAHLGQVCTFFIIIHVISKNHPKCAKCVPKLVIVSNFRQKNSEKIRLGIILYTFESSVYFSLD